MPLTVRAIRRNSPRSRWSPERRSMVWVRSPAATAPSTRPTSTVGRTSSSTRSLAAVTAPAQAPAPVPGRSRSSSRPSRPTTRRTRSSSPVRCRLRSTTSLTTVASRAIGLVGSPGTRSRTWKSPSRTAVSAVEQPLDLGRVQAAGGRRRLRAAARHRLRPAAGAAVGAAAGPSLGGRGRFGRDGGCGHGTSSARSGRSGSPASLARDADDHLARRLVQEAGWYGVSEREHAQR